MLSNLKQPFKFNVIKIIICTPKYNEKSIMSHSYIKVIIKRNDLDECSQYIYKVCYNNSIYKDICKTKLNFTLYKAYV